MQNVIFKMCLILCLAAICCRAQDVTRQNVGVLTGTVKLREKALSGVAVIVRLTDGRQRSSLSNSKGEYEIRNLEKGAYLLTVGNTPYVLSDGIAGTFMQLEINGSGVTTTDIALTEGGVATGCVEYASKQPAIERQVIYENTNLVLSGFSLMTFRNAITTNDQGCFRLYGLPSGKYRVGIGKPVDGLSTVLSVPFSPNYYPGVQRREEAQLVEITAGQESNLGRLVLKNQTRTGSVKGTFVNSATGNPVPSFSFQLVRYNEGVISSISTLKSDEAGEFQVENQALGRYRIQPVLRSGRDTSFTFQSVPFDLSETDKSEFVIQCTSLSASIRGEVIINNNSLAGDKDCSLALKSGEGLGVGDSDIYRINLDGGKFELSGLPRGVYSLLILPLRPSLQYEQVQVGTQFLVGPAGPFGMPKIDLTAGEQVVKIFLKESADRKP